MKSSRTSTRRRAVGAAAAAIVTLPLACRVPRAPAASPRVDVLVVAPHPDDEVLIAGGVMRAAVARGERVAVVVMTNGDYRCSRDGYARERETIDAVARAGVAEDDVHFLGYPDGYLAVLGDAPVPVERRGADGACIRSSTTYGARGAGRADAHTARTGAPAPYTAAALEGDLVVLLEALAPRHLYVTHPIDDHPDHAATYAYVRRALEQARTVWPVIHRAVVHAGPCWPDGRDRVTPCPEVSPDPDAAMPPLPDPLGAYVAAERAPVDGRWKLRTLERFPSQTGGDASRDWLGSFARAEEPTYPEVLVSDPAAPSSRRRQPAVGVASGQAEVRGGWTVESSVRRSRSVAQRAPLVASAGVTVLDDASSATLEILRTPRDGYRLRVDRHGTRATLLRDDSATPRVLRAWSLPEDAPFAREPLHAYTLRFDPRPDDGEVTEITLRRDARVIGVAVDARPPPRGETIAVETDGAARVSDPAVSAEAR